MTDFQPNQQASSSFILPPSSFRRSRCPVILHPSTFHVQAGQAPAVPTGPGQLLSAAL